MAPRIAHRSLSDGVILEATIVARLLGVKLLRVNAHVMLMPADVESVAHLDTRTALPQPRQRPDGGTLSDAVMLLAHASETIRDAHRKTS